MRKEGFDGFLVADEVVVYEVDVTPIAQPIDPPVEFYDVAELAGKWTAARELYADMEIVVEFQDIEAWDRRLGHVGLKFFRLELPFARARFPGFDEFADYVFGFTKDAKVGRPIEVRT
jgi:hypothetical protein